MMSGMMLEMQGLFIQRRQFHLVSVNLDAAAERF
jgi:hypothetical protein